MAYRVIDGLCGHFQPCECDVVFFAGVFEGFSHETDLAAVVVSADHVCVQEKGFYSEACQVVGCACRQIGADFLVIAVFHGESFFGAWNVVCQYVHGVFHACGIWFEEYGVNVFGVKQGFVFGNKAVQSFFYGVKFLDI